ncbi:hypothetical protein POTOM_040410 [Populus tomentosa]|uniref:Malonyl-CoA decarboxylase family protein n=1 Tax=Populus tomentosa TaxID=118781 RepID=A0A8X7YKP7_POPTO|nr:hypothetical protein POTOM_040410 [Populus tomentosa]
MRSQNGISQMMSNPPRNEGSSADSSIKSSAFGNHTERNFDVVKDSMDLAISLNKTESLNAVLDDFSEGYFSLSNENRKKLLLVLAKEYDLNRNQVRELLKQYLGLELQSGNEGESSNVDDFQSGALFSAFCWIEKNLRQALKPMYDDLFERLNNHTGGLKFLSILRADILSILEPENIVSLRALEYFLKEKLSTWLSPAALELHQITWDDSASLLEKIVAYEAVHPINNLLDLKRRLGIGRRCFGYLHTSIPGINLGKFLIKRVITLVKRDMPQVSTFATLSPIPGYMQWLLSKLASQSVLAKGDNTEQPAGGSGSTFQENLLEPDEERMLMNSAP